MTIIGKCIEEIEIRDVVILKTVIDTYIGFVSEIDKKYGLLWISQTESLLEPMYFNYSEIKLMKKLT